MQALTKLGVDQPVCFETFILGTDATFACFHKTVTWPCLTDAFENSTNWLSSERGHVLQYPVANDI